MTAAAAVAREFNHEELFLERYDRLYKWALQLTSPDRELAKDLVQDAFVHFMRFSGDLVSINNIDNYLFGVVRNTHLSHIRRNSRQQHEQLPTFDFNAVELLVIVDPRRQMRMKDELRAICHYACARKETSITGSVLILRFFHGYFPSEIARLMHSTRNRVDVQLRVARSEAIACLRKASRRINTAPPLSSSGAACVPPDILTELREKIFATTRGDCYLLDQLAKIFQARKAVSRGTLSHLVSCARCLDETNRLLGLPLLNQRDAIDVLRRETDRPPYGRGGGNPIIAPPK
jgi:RNA polymerase sigma factor (sigma-70 family)